MRTSPGSNRSGTGAGRPPDPPGRRSLVVSAAMEVFAADGFDGARVDKIASQAGVSKAAVFAYFGNKAGLFLAAYKAAASSLDAYLEAPAEVVEEGFFGIIGYWLRRSPHLIRERWVPYRMILLGNYCSDLRLRREILDFVLREDPWGTMDLIRFGISRGEVRRDVNPRLVLMLTNWLIDACQDAIVTEELDPGLFGLNTLSPEERERNLSQFVELLRGAVEPRQPLIGA